MTLLFFFTVVAVAAWCIAWHGMAMALQIAGTVWEKFDKELGGTEMKPGDDQSLLDTNYVTQLLSSVSFFFFKLALRGEWDVGGSRRADWLESLGSVV